MYIMKIPSEYKQKFNDAIKGKNYSNEQKSAIIEWIKLLDKYSSNESDYKYGKEAKTRIELIDPFFECMGWDIRNVAGHSNEYKDVHVEDTIRIEGSKKAPDYTFTATGRKKFYVEAKKPSVNLKKEICPAYQVRRYAWSSQKAISILTDFQEFAVYDCTKKPKKTDKPNVARIMYINHTEYLDNFQKIWDMFSKKSILYGKFDKFTDDLTDKKGNESVDDEFLKDMEKWRELLAIDINHNNKSLSESKLNFCVQKTIERILFLRICEDKGIEHYGDLKKIIMMKDVYKHLCEKYKHADEKYNSGLFDFLNDNVTMNISISDKTLKNIISGLYYPESPYDFTVLNVEILGSAYERFLGKIIKIVKKRIIIEDKPEVKRSNGIFYTPDYIVENIVINTVSKKIKSMTPKQIEKIKILDPACGSGTFLVRAYAYLLKYHLEYYIKNTIKNKKRIYQSSNGNWFLKTSERKKILMNNIFGIDVDSQAVEITKLSLLLKVLENESLDPDQFQKKLKTEKALPNLQNNILCGNTLIGFDIRHQIKSYDVIKSMNPFDWDAKQNGFYEIFNTENGGFDIIIGNPPYVRVQKMNKTQTDYFEKCYSSASKTYDLYMLFVEQCFSKLRKNGVLSYILPSKFFSGTSGEGLRKFIVKNNAMHQLINFKTNQIFKNAVTYTCILSLQKNKRSTFEYKQFNLGDDFKKLSNIEYVNMDKNILLSPQWNFSNQKIYQILNKIKTHKNFDSITEKIFKGFSTGNEEIFVLDFINEENGITKAYSKYNGNEAEIESNLLKPFLRGKDVRRYIFNKTSKLVLFPYEKNNKGDMKLIEFNVLKNNYPLAFKYLLSVKDTLQLRKDNSMTEKTFYKYSAGRSMSDYEQKKIIIPDILISNRVGIDMDGIFYHNAIHSVVFSNEAKKHDPLYYLGVLNSPIFWFFIKNTSTAIRGDSYRLTPQFLKPFCFPVINDMNHVQYTSVVSNVSDILNLLNKMDKDDLKHDKIYIQNQITSIEQEMFETIFTMYNFTNDEKNLIIEDVDCK